MLTSRRWTLNFCFHTFLKFYTSWGTALLIILKCAWQFVYQLEHISCLRFLKLNDRNRSDLDKDGTCYIYNLCTKYECSASFLSQVASIWWMANLGHWPARSWQFDFYGWFRIFDTNFGFCFLVLLACQGRWGQRKFPPATVTCERFRSPALTLVQLLPFPHIHCLLRRGIGSRSRQA